MEDDAPVVTEWTPNGLPQRRSRLRSSFGSEQAVVPAPAPEPDPYTPRAPEETQQPEKEEPQPGIWLEAFTKAANGVPQEPSAVGESGEPWDKGDLA